VIGRPAWLTPHPAVFRAMTGIGVAAYRQVVRALAARYAAAEQPRCARPTRRRAIGGGRRFTWSLADQVLLPIIWPRQAPAFPVLGALFGLDDRPASRPVARLLPLLEAAGRDSMRLPDPGPHHRRDLPQLLKNTPGLMVLVDTFAQRVQRPADRAEQRQWDSGKKQAHTIKSQVGVEEATGRIGDVADSVPGPTADSAVLTGAAPPGRLPPGTGLMGDSADQGLDKLQPAGSSPRKKPQGPPRPDEDRSDNRARARRRIRAAHSTGRLRRFEALSARARPPRAGPTRRVCAVAGLVNRQLAR
jgi:DDE superfamily endonuclease